MIPQKSALDGKSLVILALLTLLLLCAGWIFLLGRDCESAPPRDIVTD